jgi:acetoin utilization protein AcuB
MFVSMWMTEDVLTTHPQALLADVASLMADRRIRRMPVLRSARDPALVGIISATDVLRASPSELNPLSSTAGGITATDRLRTSARTVAEVMTGDPLTTTPETPIEAVAILMRDRKIGALPVVRHNELVGLITESDIFRAFASLFEGSAESARITFDISRGEDVFPLIAELVQRHQLRLVSLITLHHHDRPMCVVSVAGAKIDPFLDDVWRSHHRVEHVLRAEIAADDAAEAAAT